MAIMKITSHVPSRRVSNTDILELVLERSITSTISESQLINQVSRFLKTCGAEYRYWRNNHNSPQEALNSVINESLTSLNPKDIDIVIFCSATKYFAEPAHASFVNQEYNLHPKISFDISDGCLGWLSALSTIDAYSSKDKSLRYALVITHEFPMGKNGALYPNSFKLLSEKDIAYKLPSLTVGEASTATIIDLQTPTLEHDKRIEFSQGADLCSMPFRNYRDFSEAENIDSPEQFHAYYNSMTKIAARASVNLLKEHITSKNINLFTHSYTEAFQRFSKYLPYSLEIFNYFSIFGNIATSTLPLSIDKAYKERSLVTQYPLYCWCASAGLKSMIAKVVVEIN